MARSARQGERSTWRGRLLAAASRHAAAPLGFRTAAVDARECTKRLAHGGNYYKEGRGIPHPIVLRRWAGHGRAEEVAGEVLALSKMDWNNDGLYNIGPVTLAYAATLAQIMKMLRDVPPDPRPFRLFM